MFASMKVLGGTYLSVYMYPIVSSTQ